VTVAGRESVKVELQIDESIVTSAARAQALYRRQCLDRKDAAQAVS